MLEYKSSKLLGKGEIQAVCKAVSAFANSAGGTFILGIDASDEKLALDGGWRESSKLDWLHRAINSGTFPAVETVDIAEISAETGRYYVIAVGVSPKAPHQSQDHRYYKRRGSHSDPMEHYEIEDIRNRPKNKALPLEISLFPQGQLVSFKLRNVSNSEVIDNLKVGVEANFPFERKALARLKERGLRQLRPSVEHVFLIDSFFTILNANPEPELQVSVTYERHGHFERDSITFYLADYMNASIVKTPVVSALGDLGGKLDTMAKTLEKLCRHAETFERATDGSGLRLSQRTIKSLLKQDQRFDPTEFDWEGYRIILDITTDEAFQFYHIFGVMGGKHERMARYKEIPAALRERFEAVFKVDVESDED
ncbi:ATP-binding protein [Rhizobium anhuiense]|nr:ATP-binding protein [Rhizobium anhuiense]